MAKSKRSAGAAADKNVKLYDTEEAAKFLGYTTGTMAQMRFHKRGPKSVKIKGRVYYAADDLVVWRAARDKKRADAATKREKARAAKTMNKMMKTALGRKPKTQTLKKAA